MFEFVLAAATLTSWPLLDERANGDANQRARAMALLPVIGLGFGVTLAAIDRLLAYQIGLLARSIAVLAIAAVLTLGLELRGLAETIGALRGGARGAATGIARIGPLGAAVAIVAFAAQVWLLARIAEPSARAGALVMAAMLSHWTIVPVGYGLKPLERWGLGVPYEGGLTFREFAISSVLALGSTMALYENVGLAVIVALALAILAMRLLLSRRLGGAAGYSLAAASAISQIVIFAELAALSP